MKKPIKLPTDIKFPSDVEIAEVLRKLENKPGTRLLRPNATTLERLKFDICAEFVRYRLRTKVSQKGLAERIGVDTALISKILRYRFDEFTVDRLLRYLDKLHDKITITVKTA